MLNSIAKEKEEEDIFQATISFLKERHFNGDLPIILMIGVVVVNLLLFDFPTGYEIYQLVPIIFVVITFFSRYWDNWGEWYSWVGIGALILAAIFDLTVSLTFIPSPKGGYNLFSLFTIIPDMCALISLIHWTIWVNKQ